MTTTTESSTEARVPGVTGQTFLVGESFYLRPLLETDAALATSWRQSIFPQSPARTEEWIKETIAKANPWSGPLQLGIIRTADDRIVGSITVHPHGINHWLDAKVDPLFGEVGQKLQGEAMVLVADWLINERGQPVAHTTAAACDEVYVQTLLAGGFRESARFREMLLRNGERTDRIALDFLGSKWVANLGDPYGVELPRTGTGEPRPVPPKVEVPEEDLPQNAIMVGERVYLRAEQIGDGKKAALVARRETETFFDIGRHLTAETQFDHWIKSHEKKNPPDWVTFAVCLRENDEAIGWVALIDIDYQHGYAESGSFFGDLAYRGGGYGSEAKQLMLEYAFDRLGLHMLQSWVYFANTRSAAALRKQGYREAGQINWLYAQDGSLANMVVFDLLAEEWRAMPREAWQDPNQD
jgi:RimJ/RimL family protein N-acetyltransferase